MPLTVALRSVFSYKKQQFVTSGQDVLMNKQSGHIPSCTLYLGTAKHIFHESSPYLSILQRISPIFCDSSFLCCDDSKLSLLLGAGGLLEVDMMTGHAERKRSDVLGARSDGNVAALNEVDLEQEHDS